MTKTYWRVPTVYENLYQEDLLLNDFVIKSEAREILIKDCGYRSIDIDNDLLQEFVDWQL